MHRIRVHFDPQDGMTIAEGRAADYIADVVKKAAAGDVAEYRFGQSLLISLLRLAVNRGELNHQDVMFYFEERELPVNAYGVINDWPAGFCDTEDRVIEELVLLSARKSKLKRASGNPT